MPVIVVDEVRKSFRGVRVLDGASVTVERGRCYAVVGPNGSGKSVLLRLMCRLLAPDSGSVTIAEEHLSADRRFPEDFGVIIDGPGYLPFATGFENLRRLASIRDAIGRDEILAAMAEVGLDAGLRQRVRNYSLGMRQKLGIAQAIMEHQRVLILDEPFNGLDRSSAERVRALLRRHRDEGRTIVFTSHDERDVDALATDVVELDAGRLTPR
ncbi:MAG: ABC transporter ATP-binding protein [Microbacteriaceae bacterium]